MATSRCRRVSRARYTSPIPPAPIGATISYGPSFVPAASAIIGRDYTFDCAEAAAQQRIRSGTCGIRLFARFRASFEILHEIVQRNYSAVVSVSQPGCRRSATHPILSAARSGTSISLRWGHGMPCPAQMPARPRHPPRTAMRRCITHRGLTIAHHGSIRVALNRVRHAVPLQSCASPLAHRDEARTHGACARMSRRACPHPVCAVSLRHRYPGTTKLRTLVLPECDFYPSASPNPPC